MHVVCSERREIGERSDWLLEDGKVRDFRFGIKGKSEKTMQ